MARKLARSTNSRRHPVHDFMAEARAYRRANSLQTEVTDDETKAVGRLVESVGCQEGLKLQVGSYSRIPWWQRASQTLHEVATTSLMRSWNSPMTSREGLSPILLSAADFYLVCFGRGAMWPEEKLRPIKWSEHHCELLADRKHRGIKSSGESRRLVPRMLNSW